MTTKRKTVADMLNGLNPQQREAAEAIYGPISVLASAGSGKTATLTVRIANMIDHNIDPASIFVATFTNKAANEMKERVIQAVGEEKGNKLWMGTFHSLCVRILRKHIHYLGYKNKFTIFDSSDSYSLMEKVLDKKGFKKRYHPKEFLSYIDEAKNNLWDPDFCLTHVAETEKEQIMAIVYEEYQQQLKEMSALDFGDLIMLTVVLLRDFEEPQNYWQEKFQFVMSDEFQDTNYAQLQLLTLLTHPHYNLFVVGDDNQSIYKFRGARVDFIVGFDTMFDRAREIKLERNYRSTKTIVECGNKLMLHNEFRKEKDLWTDSEQGDKIQVYQFAEENKEAAAIAAAIQLKVKKGGYDYSDFAILYRNGYQAMVIEQFFLKNFIPYHIVKGTSFYDREEIKDSLAYLRFMYNRKDDVALLRILNKPSRGIGKTSEDKIIAYANEHNVSIYRALKTAEAIPGLNKGAQGKIRSFLHIIDSLHKESERKHDLAFMLRLIIDQTKLKSHHAKDKEKGEEKIEHLNEFINLVDEYQAQHPDDTLEDFLQNISLMSSNVDTVKQEGIKMMTIHSSKGLEFPVVFLVGCNEGVFPSSFNTTKEDIEEERRLMYVGITRAEKELFITHTEKRRMFNGKGYQKSEPSRFIKNLPEELITEKSFSM